MTTIENIITKVLSGNASSQEENFLNEWISQSMSNKIRFEQEKKLWDIIGKVEKTPKINVDNAWDKFNLKKDEQVAQKSFMIYKIAAVFVLVLASSLLFFLFNESNEIMVAQNTKNEETIKNEIVPATNLASVSENNQIQKSNYKRFQKRNDSVSYKQIELVDSSSATITQNSVLKILDHTPNQPRIASLSGAGLFDIKPSDKDFILETKELKIKVQGTKFNISTATEEYNFVEITVDEGFMEVYEKNNPINKITISSNEKYIFDVEKKVFVKQTTKVENKSKFKKFVNKIFNKSH